MSEAEQKSLGLDRREFRNAMGRFTTGITVVTTVDEGEVYGMTANAFCSVSMAPPLVSIAADNESTWHKKVMNSGWYGVSVLSAEQGDLSNQFAGKPQSDLQVPFMWWDGIPVLDGAIVKLVCRVVDSHPAGDHTLHIGHVEHLDYEEGGDPLLFYTGAYNKLEVDIWETSFWW